VVLVALVLGPIAAVAAASAASAARPCVGMIVDGRLAGGGLRTGCAAGDPRSGLEALTDAGFSYAFVPRQPGQVCQIDGLPECSRNGNETYWSYWHRARGSHRWVYSGEGAATYDPEPGDTEAWVWQEGGKRLPPDIAFGTLCPQAAPAAQPTATPTRKPTAAPSRKPTYPPTAGATASTARPSAAVEATTPTTPATASTPTTPATTSPPPTATRAVPVSNNRDRSGPPWAGLAVGAAAVALLGGAAAVRSRRTGSSP
jgi:hypothetical protein